MLRGGTELQEVVEACCVLYILTCKRASRYSGVRCQLEKSGSNLVRCAHSDLKMGFTSQRCAILHFSSGDIAPHPPL